MDWYLYDRDLRHERVNSGKFSNLPNLQILKIFQLLINTISKTGSFQLLNFFFFFFKIKWNCIKPGPTVWFKIIFIEQKKVSQKDKIIISM